MYVKRFSASRCPSVVRSQTNSVTFPAWQSLISTVGIFSRFPWRDDSPVCSCVSVYARLYKEISAVSYRHMYVCNLNTLREVSVTYLHVTLLKCNYTGISDSQREDVSSWWIYPSVLIHKSAERHQKYYITRYKIWSLAYYLFIPLCFSFSF